MERIAFKVYTGEGCVCRGVITLNCLVLSNCICAFVASDPSMGLDLVEINRGRRVAHKLYEYLKDVALDMLAMKFW
eukprot:592193-Pelagomonas_calceolata.AAC.1